MALNRLNPGDPGYYNPPISGQGEADVNDLARDTPVYGGNLLDHLFGFGKNNTNARAKALAPVVADPGGIGGQVNRPPEDPGLPSTAPGPPAIPANPIMPQQDPYTGGGNPAVVQEIERLIREQEDPGSIPGAERIVPVPEEGRIPGRPDQPVRGFPQVGGNIPMPQQAAGNVPGSYPNPELDPAAMGNPLLSQIMDILRSWGGGWQSNTKWANE